MIPFERLKEKHNIFITPSSYKIKLLKELSKETTFYHAQFLTISELKKQLLYEYHPEALYQFCREFHVIPDNGAVLLEAMYNVTSSEQDTTLYNQKEWLKEKGLIIFHPAFLEQLKRSNIFIYGYEEYEMKPFLPILEQYSKVEYMNEFNHYIPTVTEYETLEEEIVGTAEKISKLLEAGVSINHIYLSNVNNDYKSVLSKIFHMFKIPFQNSDTHYLFEYQIVQDFLNSTHTHESLKDFSSILEELEHKYPKTNSFYQEIYESLITIINRYYKENRTFLDIWDILIYDLKRTAVRKENYQDVVQIVTFEDGYFKEDDYVFLIGANLGEFPPIYEDTDYFSDEQKEAWNLPTSLEKTLGVEQKVINKISSIQHVFISFKKKSPYKEYLKAPFLDAFPCEKGVYRYTNLSYNTYLLNSSLDEFVNFNHKTEHLINRYGIEPVYYGTYNNQFTGIDYKIFQKYVPYCVLSYTSMQKFFECPFKYYVSSILKIVPPFEETTSLIVGNLFHAILERYFKKEHSLEEIIKQELEKVVMTPNEKREFYLKKYEIEIKRLIKLMEVQLNRSEFQPTYFEEIIEWTNQKNIKFRIFGKIDKIMTVDDGKNSYAIVIDYKTGFSTSDLSKVIYGMNMQLLLYLYFISKDKRFLNYKLGGAYIQSISSFIPNYTEGKTMEDLLWEQSKLDGITLKRAELVSKLDTEYQISSYIKGVRVKKDGDFYTSNRLLEPDILTKLLKIVEKNIEEVENSIESADFRIAPKKFSSEFKDQVSSCSFCPYRDICYLKPKNVVRLKEYKDLEFLGGEENDTSKAK